jgi:hypothetical protein
MRFNPPSGYQAFPKSVHLWASITHPDETMSMALFDRVAASLVQEVQDKRLLAYLATGTKTADADFPIDGEVFRAIKNSDPVDLAPPHVTLASSGVVVFRETDVIKAAEIARTFPSVRVPVGEAIAWIATRDPEAVAAVRTQPTGCEGGDHDPSPDSLGKLERAIEAGYIAAFGRPFAGEYLRQIQPIPALQWNGSQGLRICFGNFSNFPDDFYAATAPMNPAVFYDLKVCRTELLDAFPAHSDTNVNWETAEPRNAQNATENERPTRLTSAAEWFRNEGKAAAESALKKRGERISSGKTRREAADIWNNIPKEQKDECPKEIVTNEAFRHAEKRAPKKRGRGGTV